MTRDERAERKRQMAEMIRAGATTNEVIARFDVSRHTVHEACVTRGVKLPGKKATLGNMRRSATGARRGRDRPPPVGS